MKMSRFLKIEAATLLIGMNLGLGETSPMRPWPLPEHWTEEETEEFFMAFNMHHTNLDAEATRRGQSLTSRAVNFKNVGIFLAVVLLKEAAYEAQLEALQKLTTVLGLDLSSPNIKVYNGNPEGSITEIKFPQDFSSPRDDLGSGKQPGNR